MAWVGIVAATLATLGSRLSVVGLLLLTVATCAAGVVRVARQTDRGSPFTRVPRARSLFDGLATASALLALGVVSLFALALFLVKPLAEYDGWAMWGMKSRALAALGGDPGVFASPAYGRLHLEYPLLLPSLHALPLQLRRRLRVEHRRAQLSGDRARRPGGGLGAPPRPRPGFASPARSSPHSRPRPHSSASSRPATQTSRSRCSPQRERWRRHAGCSTTRARGSHSRRSSSRRRA